MQQPVVRVGEWLVTPSINQISRNGRQLTLEPRLIDLLVFFAQHSGEVLREGANKQVISSQADSLIKISRIWADFFPANTSNQPI
ncbi:hypothetical protein ACSSK1_21445, partial [Escherichia coli]|uniref:hypothetical protein n=1 Tax=Escherichia coli TaxID=562 RepID=UPI00224631F7